MSSIYSGKTVEKAIEKGLNEKGWSISDVNIQIIDQGKKGFFNKQPAIVQLEHKDSSINDTENNNTKIDRAERNGINDPVSHNNQDGLFEDIPHEKKDAAEEQIMVSAINELNPDFWEKDFSNGSSIIREDTSKSHEEVFWTDGQLQIPSYYFQKTVILTPPPKVKLFKNNERINTTMIVDKDDSIHVGIDKKNIDQWVKVNIDKKGFEATIQIREQMHFECESIVRDSNSKVEISFIEEKRTSFPFDLGEIIEFIQRKGISYGTDYDAIRKWVYPETDKTKPYVIAKGKEPINGEDTKFKTLFDQKESASLPENEEATVNWFSLQAIKSVEAGDKIVEIIPPTEGENGIDVYGNPLLAKAGRTIHARLGDNVSMSDDGVYIIAALDGKPHFENNKASVHPIHIVKGDVDVNTGSLKFNGDILVEGNVKEGFAIEATGNIEVKENVTSASIFAGQHVIVEKNIIDSEVVAGGVAPYYRRITENIEKVMTNISFIQKAHDLLTQHSNFKTQDLHQGVGRLIKLLIENKLPSFESELKQFSYFIDVGTYEHEGLAKWVDKTVNKLTGLGPLSISTIEELDELYDTGKQYLDSFRHHYLSNVSHVYSRYIHHSYIQSSGNINVHGMGVYNSELFSGKDITVTGEEGVVRGGELTAEKNIDIKELGSPAGGKTLVKVHSPNGKVNSNKIYQDVTITIDNRSMTTSCTGAVAKFYYDEVSQAVKTRMLRGENMDAH